MMDTRERLAGHLYHSALDLSPEGVAALRIGHASGLTWKLADEILAVWVEGEEGIAFDLDGTIADLVADLTAAGIEIRYTNPDVLTRSAACLVAGSGDNQRDTLVAFQSNLWALLDAYGVPIRDAELDVGRAIDQLYLRSSSGEIADFWGEFFAVPRRQGELDDAYLERMVAEVLRPRGNPIAIQNAVEELTGHLITLREPWREIFTLNVSTLSGGHHFQDGSFFTWNVFQPVYHTTVTPAEREEILAIIERNRPAGCLIVGKYVDPPIAYSVADLAYEGSCAITIDLVSRPLNYRSRVLSSSLALSDGVPNYTTEMMWSLAGTLTINIDTPDLDLARISLWDERLWGNFIWRRSSVAAVVTQNSG